MGESITVERKNHNPRTIEPYVTAITAANEMAVVGRLASQEAINNRLVNIPFEARFPEGSPQNDPDILGKLTTPEALEYWVLLAVEGLRRMIHNKVHTHCERIEAANRSRRWAANSIAAWIEDGAQDTADFVGVAVKDKYNEYKTFCEDDGVTAKTQKAFSHFICDELCLRSEREWVQSIGRRKRIFRRMEKA